MSLDWQPLLLSLRLATVTTICLFVVCIPLAYRLAYGRSAIKPVFEALVTLPLVLPPTVLGFYLLLLLNPDHGLGAWLEQVFHLRLVFSFSGLLLGSFIFSLPFMMQSLQSGFQGVSLGLIEAARCLGKSEFHILLRVILPNMKASILAGLVLSFAHTLGEFGVVLMVGGNIPGVTRVASMEIYDQVESLQYSNAHWYAAIMALISFAILWLVFWANRRWSRP